MATLLSCMTSCFPYHGESLPAYCIFATYIFHTPVLRLHLYWQLKIQPAKGTATKALAELPDLNVKFSTYAIRLFRISFLSK